MVAHQLKACDNNSLTSNVSNASLQTSADIQSSEFTSHIIFVISDIVSSYFICSF